MNHGSESVPSNIFKPRDDQILLATFGQIPPLLLSFYNMLKPYSTENTFYWLYPKSRWPNNFFYGQSAHLIWEHPHEERAKP